MRIYTHYNMEIVRLRTASASAPALMSTRNTPENPPPLSKPQNPSSPLCNLF